ncbi:MAG: hypothetical protein WC364_12315 [Eubacteriales bacterium]|jgi:hypothetical protein
MKRTIFKTSEFATQRAALKFLATSLKLTIQRNELDGFAEACFNDNSLDELIEGLKMRAADETDCKNWGITPTQWRSSLEEALENRLFFALEAIEEE